MSRKKDKPKNSLNVSLREDVTIRVPFPAGKLRGDSNLTGENKPGETAAIPWYRQTFTLAMASGLLLWASFPPLGLALLAWVAPLGWLRLVQQAKLLGKRPYLAIWFASFLFWLAVMQGVRLAHPILYLGWFALSAYLAAYITLFVGVTRVAVHRLKIPLMLAAPILWVGLETIRGYFLTGFALAPLSHTQVRWPVVIQIANIFGAYGVSFVMMFVAACLATLRPPLDDSAATASNQHWYVKASPAFALVGSLLLVLGYGAYTINADELYEKIPSEGPNRTKIALIQQSIDTIFESDPDRNADTFEKYRQLTIETCRKHSDVELVVWPESMLSANSPAIFYDEQKIPPRYLDAVRSYAQRYENKIHQLLGEMHGPSLLAGCDARELDGVGEKIFNSAMLFGPDGKLKGRYNKMHLVMFGEYIPIADHFPLLYSITPMPRGLDRGTHAEYFEAAGLGIMPTVCFEITVPHLIRRQFNELPQAPDVLVNVSNDGWFWGSSILDLHLACSIFRAVELNRPVLVAANTGITAHIDAMGRVRQELPRRTAGAIVVEINKARRPSSWYVGFGYLAPSFCAIATLIVAALGTRRKQG